MRMKSQNSIPNSRKSKKKRKRKSNNKFMKNLSKMMKMTPKDAKN
jgi:hypothetical protein